MESPPEMEFLIFSLNEKSKKKCVNLDDQPGKMMDKHW